MAYRKTVRELSKRLAEEFGDKLDTIIVYGSIARGEYKRMQSDIDILIIAKDDSLYDKIRSIATDLDLENTTATSLVYLTRSEFERFLKLGSPFLANVMEEGEVLYEKGIFERARKSLLKASR